MSSGPNIGGLLCGWFGGDSLSFGCIPPGFSAASNLLFGSNPLYQASDFLAFYPKFGVFAQALQAAVPNAVAGSGYVVNDILNVAQPGGLGGQVKVAAVNGSGAPTAYVIQTAGAGYQLAVGVSVTGGTGTGALIDITNLVPSAQMQIPVPVIQVFINLATTSLQKAKWADSWLYGMHLCVAHYCTLYLDSEGSPGVTPAQVAVNGLGKGILVTKSAGDVSGSYQTVLDENWTSWNLTKYGQQLVTMAKVIGMGLW
jgi:hypothetical protein